MKKLLILTALCLAVWTSEVRAQSKEDLLAGTPLNPQVVINALQQPVVASALSNCGAGKLSAGTATMHVSVDAAGTATLIKTDPVLPPEVSGCLGGVIGALSLPKSGSGTEVAFLFTFTGAATGTIGQPPPPAYPPEYHSGRRMRRAGIGLVIPGSILFGLGGLVMLAYFVDTSETGALFAALGVGALGGALLIPGIILAVLGKKRMQQAMTQARFPMPGIAYDPETKATHFSLAWRF